MQGGQATVATLEAPATADLGEARVHLEALRQWAAALEPAALDAGTARTVLSFAAEVEHLGAGLGLRVTHRALQGAAWKEEGYRSSAAWLAETVRSSVPQAVVTEHTAARLEELPATTEALAAGRLSPLEAQAIAAAAEADPLAEAGLLDAAGSLTLHQFTLVAKRTARAAQDGDPDHRRRLHDRRFFRSWTDVEGQWRFSGGLSPEDGIDVLSAIRSRAVHVADEMRAAGEEPGSPAACDADAFVALVTGDERRATFAGAEGGRARRPGVVYHVHLEALRRGEVRPGELCEVPGVGPVPLRALTGVLGDATARLVIRDGVDVTTVAHLGRTVPAPVETALEARDPTCVVPNCTVALSLEIDHWAVPFAEGGPSALWNLCRLCRFHHRLKTYDGFRLVGGPGHWEWLPPD